MDIATSIANELGSPRFPFGWTEYGLKGLSMTGVLAYGDLAAEYAGYRFWSDLLSIGGAGAVVGGGVDGAPFVQQRPLSLASYVTDAWDEAINCSRFDPRLEREVEAALAARGLACPVVDCRNLALLPDARLYVNPACFAESDLDRPFLAGEARGHRPASISVASVAGGCGTLPARGTGPTDVVRDRDGAYCSPRRRHRRRSHSPRRSAAARRRT
jgi:hypothetical protein